MLCFYFQNTLLNLIKILTCVQFSGADRHKLFAVPCLSQYLYWRDYEMRTKTRRRDIIELIYDILAPNLGLIFKVLICVNCVFVLSSFSFRNLSKITLLDPGKVDLPLSCFFANNSLTENPIPPKICEN